MADSAPPQNNTTSNPPPQGEKRPENREDEAMEDAPPSSTTWADWHALDDPTRGKCVEMYLKKLEKKLVPNDSVRKRPADKRPFKDLQPNPMAAKGAPAPRITLQSYDPITAARIANTLRPGERIAIHSFADHNKPGGMLLEGKSTQEEFLCMCTSLYPTLAVKNEKGGWLLYPLGNDELLVSPDLEIFCGAPLRNPKREGAMKVDIISCAAEHPRKPKKIEIDVNHENAHETYKNKESRKVMKDQIAAILRAAVERKSQTLILGAYGTGIFHHPTYDVARCTVEVITNKDGETDDWKAAGLEHVILAVWETDPNKQKFQHFGEVVQETKDHRIDWEGEDWLVPYP